MRPTLAYADLRRFGRPVVTTRDVALRLRMTIPAASKLMRRLAADGLVLALRRGLWALSVDVDPLVLPEYITAPFPSYVSLLTALSLHGMLSQVPRDIYLVSLGRPQRVKTSIATFSIHRLPPTLFGGFTVLEPAGIQLATPAKALVDVLYLSRSRSRLFAKLPEVELAEGFDPAETRRWIERIPAAAARTMVTRRFEAILAADPSVAGSAKAATRASGRTARRHR